MTKPMAAIRFHHYAWGVLAYNLVVILGGAFVRATVSGDGCGQHWPHCNGEILPDFKQAKTLIEFGHRVSTGILLPMVLALVIWAFQAFPKGNPTRAAAVWVLVFTLLEALIGAGLVLFKLVAYDESIQRVIVMPSHLVATFLLLMACILTAWWGVGNRTLQLRGQGAVGWALAGALVACLLLGISGAITALGDTLFQASSHEAARLIKHPIASLRIYHPLIALSTGIYIALVAGLVQNLRPDPMVRKFSTGVITLYLVQIGAGFLNYALMAPVWMQLVHLFLADLFWISLVLMTATALAQGVPQAEAAGPGTVPSAPLPEGVAAGPVGWKAYLALTKPRVQSLLVFTTLTAMFIAAGQNQKAPGFWLCVAVGLGLYMSAGAANAINMVLERDLDLAMGRTANRPTVAGAITPRNALAFALVLMIGSFLLLWLSANMLTAMLAWSGLAFYVLVYTLLLKRRTYLNIVIGGAAGAFPPLVGWAAVMNELSPLAWCLFGIIFLWTPVHFWALALMLKEDYARAGVPMLPVVRGERATVIQIACYAVLTVVISAVPAMMPGSQGTGWIYLAAVVLLNAFLLLGSFRLYRTPDRPAARSLFKYSMVYLALLFLAMAVDRTMH